MVHLSSPSPLIGSHSKGSEVLLFLEEHSKADDGSIDKYTANDAHYHCWNRDNLGVRQYSG